ncbi:MAG: YbhB/YbcL family Raf kinase inhibitor-like protein [Desulfomonilaceae bacterium]
MALRVCCLFIALLFFGFCGGQRDCYPKAKGGEPMKIEIKSSAFQDGGMIPKLYTCDGQDFSPALSWSGVPSNAKSLALIVDDPDAPVGTWVHWVVFNIPPGQKELVEKILPSPSLNDGARHGKNSWGKLGYGGPCPPGGTHRYYFKLYALDRMLDLQSGITKSQLLKAMEGHILSEGQLMGKYRRM